MLCKLSENIQVRDEVDACENRVEVGNAHCSCCHLHAVISYIFTPLVPVGSSFFWSSF